MFKIFYSKFLDISHKIIADGEAIKPEIIITEDDLEKQGKNKDIVLLYIKISLLFQGESLQILFNFLNQNYTSLNTRFFIFRNKSDFTNINILQQVYNNIKFNKTNNKKDNFEIKIILEDANKKKMTN